MNQEIQAQSRSSTGFRSGCSGKERFQSNSHARLVQQRMGKPVQEYHCRHCGFWHVGGKSTMATSQTVPLTIQEDEIQFLLTSVQYIKAQINTRQRYC